MTEDDVIGNCACSTPGLRMSAMRLADWIQGLRWPYTNRQAWFVAMLRGNTTAGVVLRAIFDNAVHRDKRFGDVGRSFRLDKETIAATTGLRPDSLKSPIALLTKSGLVHAAAKGFPRTTHVYPCLSRICAAIAQGCSARVELPHVPHLIFPGATFTAHSADEREGGPDRRYGLARDAEPDLGLSWPDPSDAHRAPLLTLHHLVRQEHITHFFSRSVRYAENQETTPMNQ